MKEKKPKKAERDFKIISVYREKGKTLQEIMEKMVADYIDN